MVSLSDAGEPVRSSLPASAVADDPARRRVLDRLARARLVTTDQESFELAHEALARAWPRLRSWLDEGVEEQQLVRHLAASATGWDALGRSDSELYRGARLQSATEWLAARRRGPDAAGARVPRHLAGPRRRRSPRDRASDPARTPAEPSAARAPRRCRRPAARGGWHRRCRARPRTATPPAIATSAEQASEAAAHEALVGRSLTLRSTNRSVAALLAVQAFRARTDHLSQSALLGSFTASPSFLELPVPRGRRPAQRRRDPEHPACHRRRGLRPPRRPQHQHRRRHPLFRSLCPRRAGLLGPAGQHGRQSGGPTALHAARPKSVRQPRVARGPRRPGLLQPRGPRRRLGRTGARSAEAAVQRRRRGDQRRRGGGGGHRGVRR